MVLGIVGAVVGGVVANAVGASGITGFNVCSFIVAIAGSVLVLWIYHAVTTDVIRALTQRSGLSEAELSAQLSHILPDIVDKLTPRGRPPTEAELAETG